MLVLIAVGHLVVPSQRQIADSFCFSHWGNKKIVTYILCTGIYVCTAFGAALKCVDNFTV